jgi:hypothetical protein
MTRYVKKNVYWSLYKVPVILVKFFDKFSKNSPIPNFMKIRIVAAELFHADWRRASHD